MGGGWYLPLQSQRGANADTAEVKCSSTKSFVNTDYLIYL